VVLIVNFDQKPDANPLCADIEQCSEQGQTATLQAGTVSVVDRAAINDEGRGSRERARHGFDFISCYLD
jgi:hypothetical protein